jgi:hypothetical protein
MSRIAVTILLIVAWHFPTTFFVPQDAPNERGWLIWPFGRASTPVLDGLQGAIAPASPATLGSPTLAMVAAGLASLAFIVAIASLWGIVIPSAWMQPAAVIGAVSSMALFLIYLSPLSVVPVVADLVVLWGVLVADWNPQTFSGS